MALSKYFVGLLIGSTVFVSSVFVLIFAFFVFSTTRANSESKLTSTNIAMEYQAVTFDPETKKTTFGSVRVRELDPKGYQTYVNSEGNHVLISPFDSSEFHCSGSCFCQDSNQRRSIGVIPRTVNFLLAAASLFVAHELAEKYFEDECQKTMLDECSSPSAITSEVIDCEPLVSVEANTNTNEGSTSSVTKIKYTCQGFCNPMADYLTSSALKKLAGEELKDFQERDSARFLMERFLGCEETKLEGVDFTITVDEVGQKGNLRRAKKKFVDDRLFDFCKKESEFRSQVEYTNLEDARTWLLQRIKEGVMDEAAMEYKQFLYTILEKMSKIFEQEPPFSYCTALFLGEHDQTYHNVRCRKKKIFSN